MSPLVFQLLNGFLRHAFSTVGGALVAKGFIASDESDLLVGALTTIVSVAWSAWHKAQVHGGKED